MHVRRGRDKVGPWRATAWYWMCSRGCWFSFAFAFVDHMASAGGLRNSVRCGGASRS